MKIKSIIFDVDNVLVKWAPLEVIGSIFPDLDSQDFFKQMQPIWTDLSLGKLTESEAIGIYHKELVLPEKLLANLMRELTLHQKPLAGSIELLSKLQMLGSNLFIITNNAKEIMEYHRKFSQFPKYFNDIIVSADIGFLKPDKRIYEHLLYKHSLIPSESVFIDDLLENVEGAISVGMKAFQFIDHKSCRKQLAKLLGHKFRSLLLNDIP